MNAQLPRPTHTSYQRHRKQLTRQIILPIVLTAILFVALIVLINIATFRDNGDVARWGAVSTIWIVIPIIIASLIFLAILVGLVYLLMRLLQITPVYTGQAQDIVHKIAAYIKQGADAIVKPVFFIDELGASLGRFFGRK